MIVYAAQATADALRAHRGPATDAEETTRQIPQLIPPVQQPAQLEAAAIGILTHATDTAAGLRTADPDDRVLLDLAWVLVEERVRLGAVRTIESGLLKCAHDLFGRWAEIKVDVLVLHVVLASALVWKVVLDHGPRVKADGVALEVDGLPPRVVVVHTVREARERDAVEQRLHVTRGDLSGDDLTPELLMLFRRRLSHGLLRITNEHSIAGSVLEAGTNNRFTHQQYIATPQSQALALEEIPSLPDDLIIRSPKEERAFLAQGCE